MDQLKDVILSTLAEIQENAPKQDEEQAKQEPTSKKQESAERKSHDQNRQKKENFFEEVHAKKVHGHESELLFLNSLRERMLVLFEGFQAPNNSSLEAKIDLTLNFLEYVLSSIETRIDQIKGK